MAKPKTQEPGTDSTVDDWFGQNVARDQDVADRLVAEEGGDQDAAEERFDEEAEGEESSAPAIRDPAADDVDPRSVPAGAAGGSELRRGACGGVARRRPGRRRHARRTPAAVGAVARSRRCREILALSHLFWDVATNVPVAEKDVLS